MEKTECAYWKTVLQTIRKSTASEQQMREKFPFVFIFITKLIMVENKRQTRELWFLFRNLRLFFVLERQYFDV